MNERIKEGTNIKLRKDLKVGTIDNILPNNVFTTIEYKKDNYHFSYDIIHIDEDNESKCIDKWKEINNVVSLIQKQLEEIIKKHDGFNFDVDVTIDDKIKEKLTETINKLKELDS